MPKVEKKETNRQKGIDTAIIVAIIGLIGTLTVGVLNSQVIIKLLDRSSATPAPTPENGGRLIFSEDFEDNIISGFAFDTGKWEIIGETSNFALKGTATEAIAPAAQAYFGSNDFSDGVIEFRVKFLQTQGLYLDFRFLEGKGTYVLYLSPGNQDVILATNVLENDGWQFASISADSTRSFTFQQDIWYKIQLELNGEDITLNIDKNQILTASDSKFSQGRLRFTLDANAVVELDDVKVWSTNP
jgi:hypothetical protein